MMDRVLRGGDGVAATYRGTRVALDIVARGCGHGNAAVAIGRQREIGERRWRAAARRGDVAG